jgi:transposase
MEDQATEIEVQPRKRRRTFTKSYKLRILDEYDRCTKYGERGALLRREGLYDSNICRWRKHMATSPKKTRRGRPNKTDEQREIDRMRVQITRLEGSLEEAHHVIDVQKKLCDALESLRRGKTSTPSSSTPSSSSENE